jgi:ElaB/YqjD/DUF883 family membrane-anchored ribosome-binding protein
MSEHNDKSNIADTTANEMYAAKVTADNVTKSVQSSARSLGDSIARNSSEFADKVNGKFKDAVNEAEPIVEAARIRSNDIRTALIDEIKARPLQAVMVAGLAGLVVGVLTSR